jgi:hypothetical protein
VPGRLLGAIQGQQPLQRRRRLPLGQVQQPERPRGERRDHRQLAWDRDGERLLGQPPAGLGAALVGGKPGQHHQKVAAGGVLADLGGQLPTEILIQ